MKTEKEQGDIINPVEKQEIDYESLGKWLKRIRKKHGLSQEVVADEYFHVSRTVLSKYEKGTVRPPDWELVETFARDFNENIEEIRNKVSVAIPDTSALLKNKRLLHLLLENYDQVVIPLTVKDELSYRKNHGKDETEKRVAWQMMANMDYFMKEYPERFRTMDNRGCKIPTKTGVRNIENDLKMIELAKDLAKKTIGDVEIITDDVDISAFYDKAVKIDDYTARRTVSVDLDVIRNLDREFDQMEYYKKAIGNMPPGALDIYLTDGMTLLISCITCNHKKKLEQEERRPVPPEKVYKKIRFLLENGADPDRNDNGRYCLPPLAHCIQMNDYKAFMILLEHGCDYNKASRDERISGSMRVGKLNEGNTPLMIACWCGRKRYVEKLCEFPDISLNQQDSNGYTALIKCAVQRFNMMRACKKYHINEDLYVFLLRRGADPLIRDRNNMTAKDWWDKADALEGERTENK